MQRFSSRIRAILFIGILLSSLSMPSIVRGQDNEEAITEEETPEEAPAEQGIVPPIAAPGAQEGQEEGALPPAAPRIPVIRAVPPGETAAPAETATPGVETAPTEGETRWDVKINAAIRAHYVFNDSPDNFVVKYRWEIKGQANANTAVIRGDADINADVEGFLSKWPTGQCKLEIGISKVPYEVTFQRNGEDKGSIALQFRRPITEDWQSRCSFTDAPGAKFDTRGEPEKILARAIEKARPPLRSIVTDIKNEETTTTFVISKEVIDDPPLGTIEIEGTGVVTVTPGGGVE